MTMSEVDVRPQVADPESRLTALEHQLHRLEELQDGDRATLRLHGLLHEQNVEVQREHELMFREQRSQVSELGGRLRKLLAIVSPRLSTSDGDLS